MSLPAYVQDILSQPNSLRRAIQGYPAGALDDLRLQLERGDFKRIVLTGMGASLFAAYPATLELARLPLPVSLVETAELLHFFPEQVTDDALMWIVSQSGRSAEVRGLVDLPNKPAFTLATTNEMDSPLAQSADLVLPLYAGDEYTVSTKTYLNTLAVLALAVGELTGQSLTGCMDALNEAAEAVEEYLSAWQDHVEELKKKVGLPRHLYYLGRGPSLAAAETGRLIVTESAKFLSQSMSAGAFRHGPLELADETLVTLIFAGPSKTRDLNLSLARDILRYGGKAFWVDDRPADGVPLIRIPKAPEIARPIVEILPLQLLSLALAEQNGVIPGEFRNIGKVVLEE